MALKITDTCINCGVCLPECPNGAIEEGEEIFVIRARKCTECIGVHNEPQCQSLCPIPDCIIVNPNRQETQEQLLDKKSRLDAQKKVSDALETLDWDSLKF